MAAREIADHAGVPILPAATHAVTSLDEARKLAAKLGYPVMVKASNGGGGRGMRVVLDEASLRPSSTRPSANR